MRITLILFAWFFLVEHGYSQESCVFLQGKVLLINLSDSLERPLEDVPIEIWADDSLLATIYSQEKGKYKFSLPFFHRYKIRYGGGDNITKVVEVDASDFAQETRIRGYILDVDVLLFEKSAVSGLEFLETEPIARAFYNKVENTVVWDAEQTEQTNRKIAERLANSR